jgi:hypothetical protein
MDLLKEYLYIIINKNKQAIGVSFGDEKRVRQELLQNQDIVLVTEELTPINQGDYYDGNKFVKELKNVI